MRAVPWKSGASAPRKAAEISAGFSPCGRILYLHQVFPQPPLSAAAKSRL